MDFRKLFYFIIPLFFLVSCDEKKKVDAGTIEANTYHSEEVGWKINIPDGWRVMNAEQRHNMNERGKSTIQSATGVEIETNELKNLIGFQKDRQNIFNSTIEAVGDEKIDDWEENNEALKEVIMQTYTENGISAYIESSSKETISGIEFDTFTIKMKLPNGEIFTQIMYSAIINDYVFGVNINYLDPKYGQEMIDAFKTSKFEKK